MNRFVKQGRFVQRSRRPIPSRLLRHAAAMPAKVPGAGIWREEQKEEWDLLWTARMTRGNHAARIALVKDSLRRSANWSGSEDDLEAESAVTAEYLDLLEAVDRRDSERMECFCMEHISAAERL